MDKNLTNLIIALARALEIPVSLLAMYFKDTNGNQRYLDAVVGELSDEPDEYLS